MKTIVVLTLCCIKLQKIHIYANVKIVIYFIFLCYLSMIKYCVVNYLCPKKKKVLLEDLTTEQTQRMSLNPCFPTFIIYLFTLFIRLFYSTLSFINFQKPKVPSQSLITFLFVHTNITD